jgi:hypothetical protein
MSEARGKREEKMEVGGKERGKNITTTPLSPPPKGGEVIDSCESFPTLNLSQRPLRY